MAQLQSQDYPYEALDGPGVPTRDAKRRGAGWLAGQADISWSNRLGWYEGFHLLVSANPQGVITGFSFAPASTKDQTMAEDFFAFRHDPQPRVPTVGDPAVGYYVVDKGFEGQDRHQHWYHNYGPGWSARPKATAASPGPKK